MPIIGFPCANVYPISAEVPESMSQPVINATVTSDSLRAVKSATNILSFVSWVIDVVFNSDSSTPVKSRCGRKHSKPSFSRLSAMASKKSLS